MAKVDFRLRINGQTSDDSAQVVAKLAIALREAGYAAKLESVLDLGGLVLEPDPLPATPIVPTFDPHIVPAHSTGKKPSK